MDVCCQPMVRGDQLELSIGYFRRLLWHLRKGGIHQAQQFISRRAFGKEFGGGTAYSIKRLPARGRKVYTDLPDYVPLRGTKRFADVKVGLVCDDFSLLAWQHEFSAIALDRRVAVEQMKRANIDLLLVESTWAGASNSWKGKLAAPACDPVLKTVIQYCKERKIPTVFWNKEDPVHYADFLATAREFDYVATTAAEAVGAYKNALQHDRVVVMPFAASPPLHNPVRDPSIKRDLGVAFAGTYYREKFPERRRVLDELLLGASKAVGREEQLAIYSRHWGGESRYQFPYKFKRYVKGRLTYDQMLVAYRRFRVFLNSDSVQNSKTMMSRRVWELIACGTPVVTGENDAWRSFFQEGEGIFAADSAVAAERKVRTILASPELVERCVHRGQRRIWEGATYTHRAQQLLDLVGIKPERPISGAKVSIVCSTYRSGQIDHLLAQVNRQSYSDLELILVLHGIEITELDQVAISSKLRVPLKIIESEEGWKLGDCLNAGVQEASGTIIAKFDDDDFYGQNYIRDSVNALNWSGAAVVGKAATYVHLKDLGIIVRKDRANEHKWFHRVSGATIVARRSVFDFCQFGGTNAGEDSAFLAAVVEKGFPIYSADRFNYMTVRTTAHTWKIADEEILAQSTAEVFGGIEDHANC